MTSVGLCRAFDASTNQCRTEDVDCSTITTTETTTTTVETTPTTTPIKVTYAAGNCPSQCVIGIGKPCQDINGVKGGKNNCYNPDAGTGSCAAGLFDCRAITTTVTTKATTTRTVPKGAPCKGCIVGVGPCKTTSGLCRAFELTGKCRAGDIECSTITTTTATTTTATTTTTTTIFCANPCVIGVGKACQDINGVKGGKNNCYAPTADGTCQFGLFDCRGKTTTRATQPSTTTRKIDRLCKNCIIGQGPCKTLAGVCKIFGTGGKCGATEIECALLDTTMPALTTTKTTLTTDSPTPTTTVLTTPTTNTLEQICDNPCYGETTGSCVVDNSQIQRDTVLCFEPKANGMCWKGTRRCKTTTSSTSTTTSSTTSTTSTENSLCRLPCSSGTYGPCREQEDTLADGATCSDTIADSTSAKAGQCDGTTSSAAFKSDCRKTSYLEIALPSPAGKGLDYTCKPDECSDYSVNAMEKSVDARLNYTRRSYGHCREPQTGICVPYMPGTTDCWPSTVACGAAVAAQSCHDVACAGEQLCAPTFKMACMSTVGGFNFRLCRKKDTNSQQCPSTYKNCQARVAGGKDESRALAPAHTLCCSCAWSDDGPTAGPCQHPETKLCFNYTDATTHTCLAGTTPCLA